MSGRFQCTRFCGTTNGKEQIGKASKLWETLYLNESWKMCADSQSLWGFLLFSLQTTKWIWVGYIKTSDFNGSLQHLVPLFKTNLAGSVFYCYKVLLIFKRCYIWLIKSVFWLWVFLFSIFLFSFKLKRNI